MRTRARNCERVRGASACASAARTTWSGAAAWGPWSIRGIRLGVDLQVRLLVALELQGNRLGRRRAPVLGRQEQSAAMTPHVEQGVGPGEEVARAAQALACLAAGAPLAGVVHDDDGHVVGALDLSQVPEHGRHLTGVVLVDAVQPHEGIEHQQARRVRSDRRTQSPLVVRAVEAQGRRGDEVDGERAEVEPTVTADAA